VSKYVKVYLAIISISRVGGNSRNRKNDLLTLLTDGYRIILPPLASQLQFHGLKFQTMKGDPVAERHIQVEKKMNKRLLLLFLVLIPAAMLLTGCLAVEEEPVLMGGALISWDPPTEREDGSTIEGLDLAGYRVYYGAATGSYTKSVLVTGSTSAVISGLNAGSTYYFVITALDSVGNESDPSDEVHVYVQES
jgi:hypothetical protein